MDKQEEIHLSPLPLPSLSKINSRQELQQIRRGILERTLRTTILFTSIAFVIAFVFESQLGQWNIIFSAAICYIWLLVITFVRRLPYQFRMVNLLIVVYVMGTASLMTNGLAGTGRIFLLSVPILATILAGRKAGILSLIISLATIALAGYWITRGNSDFPSDMIATIASDSGFWITGLFTFLMLSMIALNSQSGLEKGLETSIENTLAMADQLESRKTELEGEVHTQSTDLERRIVQIHTAGEISRSLSALVDPELLLEKVVALVQERFDLYYVGVFLLDEYGEYAVLRTGSGEAGKQMTTRGHRLAVGGESMIGWCTANRQPRIALDVGKEAVRFENPFLPQTRSELALPILAGERVLGALTVQSSQPEAFDDADITVLQGIADSLGIALENARLLAETQQRLEEIENLHRQYLAKSWSHVPIRSTDLEFSYEPDQVGVSDNGTHSVEIPLLLRTQHIGSLSMELGQDNLTPLQESLIDGVMTQAALALENIRLLQESQRQAERDRLSASISSQIWSTADTEVILKTALRQLGKALNVSQGMIQLKLDE